MKKFITLLFFAGIITTGFAQSGHRQQNNSQPNGNGYHSNQNSGNSHNQYSQSSGNGDYQDHQQGNSYTKNDYGYNKSSDKRDRGDVRGNQNDYTSHNQRGWAGHSYQSRNGDSRHQRMYPDDDRD